MSELDAVATTASANPRPNAPSRPTVELTPHAARPPGALSDRAALVSRYAATLVAGTGVAVLFGWVFSIPVLKSVAPGFSSMKPNTALSFALLGVALLLWSRTPSGWVALSMTRVCGGLVLIIGLASGLEDLAGVNLGIDELLFRDDAPVGGAPGRMAPATAANFALLGAALVLLSTGRLVRVAEALTLLATVQALVLLLGFAYGVESLYSFGHFGTVAPHTAAAFLVLCVGLLLARPGPGLAGLLSSASAGGQTARRLLPWAVVVPFGLGWLRLLGERAGWYDLPLGLAGFAATNIVIISGLIWLNALRLDRAEAHRQRAEATLRFSEARFRRLYESPVIGIMFADTRGGISGANDAFLNTLGYTRADLDAGRLRWDALTPPEQRAGDEHALAELRRFGSAQPWEKEYLRADGRRVPVVIGAAMLEGSPEQAIAFVLDISERKRAEERLRRVADELARSNAELEQFAYSASHDLQEPLRAIGGCAQLLQRRYQGQLDGQADEIIGHITRGADRMHRLIEDLLALSRVGVRGREFAPIDSNAALADALANLRSALEESGAQVTAGALPQVLADRAQLIQLFQNLVGNALKFRAAGRPEIRVDAGRDGDFWRFAVRDNGIGIAPEYHERIFGVFRRLHTATAYPGTGIGLALCKKIVARHGGHIWVESALGQGATFYFTLPAPKDLK